MHDSDLMNKPVEEVAMKGFVKNIDEMIKAGDAFFIRESEAEVVDSTITAVKNGECLSCECPADIERHCFIHRGKGEITFSGAAHPIKAGDSIYLPKGTAYEFRCISEEDLVFMTVSIHLDREPEV